MNCLIGGSDGLNDGLKPESVFILLQDGIDYILTV
jgi:hypothetical protein